MAKFGICEQDAVLKPLALSGPILLNPEALPVHLQKEADCICHARDILEKVSAPRSQRSL